MSASGTHLAVDLEIEDGSWFEHTADHPVVSGRIERVGCLPRGTKGGQPSFEALVVLPDGTRVVAETTWRNMALAAVALIARWGTP